MRTSYIKDNNEWKKINQLYIKDQSIWTDVKEAYVKKDDQWRLWYVKSIPTMESLSLDLNASGSLDVSISGGSYYVTQPTEYRALVDGVVQTSSSTTTIANIPITSGANRTLSIQFWRGDFLLYTLTKSFRLFDYTGSSQSWVVPSGVSTVMSDVQGAQGGNNLNSGGRIKGNISVTAGNTIYILVGGQGGSQASFSCQGSSPPLVAGGYNGGGTGGGASDSFGCAAGLTAYRRGASGGGATDIRTSVGDLATRLIVAGGGGGGNQGGGLGGGQNGTDGVVFDPGLTWGQGAKGGGATISAGGAFGDGVADGTGGSFGQGGNGGIIAVFGDNPGFAGGGGGGYYGGGGGGVNSNFASAGSGGGGSGYISGGSFEVATQGYRSGNGIALVSW
jgi:hypothetical protein